MRNADIQILMHMETYCEDILETISRFGRDCSVFISDKDYCNSVSMSMMQIGELSGSLSDEFKDATRGEMKWSAIKGMRNLFAHAYASMDKQVIWEAALRDIPDLMNFCRKMIESVQE